MVQIDGSNTAIVGLDLYTVAERHQSGLVDAIKEQIQSWKSNPYFMSASVHQSLDGVRVFTYSQWQPKFDHRSLQRPVAFGEFFPPDLLQVEVSASKSTSAEVEIAVGLSIVRASLLPIIKSYIERINARPSIIWVREKDAELAAEQRLTNHSS